MKFVNPAPTGLRKTLLVIMWPSKSRLFRFGIHFAVLACVTFYQGISSMRKIALILAMLLSRAFRLPVCWAAVARPRQ